MVGNFRIIFSKYWNKPLQRVVQQTAERTGTLNDLRQLMHLAATVNPVADSPLRPDFCFYKLAIKNWSTCRDTEQKHLVPKSAVTYQGA